MNIPSIAELSRASIVVLNFHRESSRSRGGIATSSFFELGQSFGYRSIIVSTLLLLPLVT